MVVKWFYGSEYASVANHIYYVEWCGKTAPYMPTVETNRNKSGIERWRTEIRD
jgi:hypothetical protein